MKWSKKLGLLLLHLPTSGTRIRLQARRQGKETGREIVAGSQLEGSMPPITHSFPKCRYVKARQKKNCGRSLHTYIHKVHKQPTGTELHKTCSDDFSLCPKCNWASDFVTDKIYRKWAIIDF